jgi:hypothetical protein
VQKINQLFLLRFIKSNQSQYADYGIPQLDGAAYFAHFAD